MNFPVQLPCCHQLVNVVTWLKLIGSSCMPTTKTKTHTHSYFNSTFHIGIKDKIQINVRELTLVIGSKGIVCVGYHPFSHTTSVSPILYPSVQLSVQLPLLFNIKYSFE